MGATQLADASANAQWHWHESSFAVTKALSRKRLSEARCQSDNEYSITNKYDRKTNSAFYPQRDGN